MGANSSGQKGAKEVAFPSQVIPQTEGESRAAKPNRKASVFAAQAWQEKQAKSEERKGKEKAAASQASQKFRRSEMRKTEMRRSEMRKTEMAPPEPEPGEEPPTPTRKKARGGFLCCGGGADDVAEKSSNGGGEQSSKTVPAPAAPAKTKEEREVADIVGLIRSKGRTYEEGTVVLSFDEIHNAMVKDEFPGVATPTPQTLTLTAALLRARLNGGLEYLLEEEEYDDEDEDEREDEDKRLTRGKDDSVIITAQKASATAPGAKPQWRRGSLMTHVGMAAPLTELDETGDFKYVLMSATMPATGQPVTLVRGYQDCEFHADVLDAACPPLEAAGYSNIKCLGGGRIRRSAKDEDEYSKILIYGESGGFGRADHQVTAKMCRGHFGALCDVSVAKSDASVSDIYSA
jgi:hypothetical protein